MFRSIIRKVDNVVFRRMEHRFDALFDKWYILGKQMSQFEAAGDDYLASKVESKTRIEDLLSTFGELEVPVVENRVEIDEFLSWITELPELSAYYDNLGDVKVEKMLEHFLSLKFLSVQKDDVFVDVGAADSPWSDILRKRLKIKSTFKQDLKFKAGVNRRKIGGDAAHMPVTDGFADVLALHCSFECFQGSSDIGFAREAARVLKNGGRLGIIPLYIDGTHFVKSGPKADRRFIDVEPEARWIWRDDEYASEPFSRHYSPKSLKSRVMDNLAGLQPEIIHFVNLDELREKVPGQRLYCHFMLRAVKGQN